MERRAALIEDWHGGERELAALAVALGAERVQGTSPRETTLLRTAAGVRVPRSVVGSARVAIADGEDPLGTALCTLRTARERRPSGATYTPPAIVHAMVDWAAGGRPPERIVDPGAGSGRFCIAAASVFPRANLLAVELDPLAALLCRANLAARRLDRRARVLCDDYRSVAGRLASGAGTLFIGNPPYVRHHDIDPIWKVWLTETAAALGIRASQLAGLHAHFVLATATAAQRGDRGVFITSAEWLDVNYGSLMRQLFAGQLGGSALHVLEPDAMPFEDANTTAVISCFEVGDASRSVRMRRVKSVAQLGNLQSGRAVLRSDLERASRWSVLTRRRRALPDGYVELGELCRVHRGAVTGMNAAWVVAPDFDELPDDVLFPSITRARELFSAHSRLEDARHLRRVVDIPEDLDGFDAADRRRIQRFLRRVRGLGAADRYIARHRRVWWSVGLREPAPILATYMARRPPAFVTNAAAARHLNIAHGLYPRRELSHDAIERLAEALRSSVTLDAGRTYAGGLTKFEPGEMERLPVPALPEFFA